jgi:4-aminobutyrate aminotransferase-like enzyme
VYRSSKKINNVVKAEGCYLYDDKGNQSIDLESGIWVVPLGHEELFNRGYLVSLRRGHNTLRIDPPLNIDEKLLDNFIAELENVLRQSNRAQSY